MPTVAWQRNDRKIIENERFSLVDHRDGIRQLIIYQPTNDDNGTYTCSATNSVKCQTETHIVDISTQLDRRDRIANRNGVSEKTVSDAVEKLAFDMFLKNSTVESGRTAKFICSVTGSVSDRQVEWLKDGRLIDFDAASTTRYERSFKGGLIILEVFRAEPEDSGEFTCRIHKGHSEITTTSKLYVFAAADEATVRMPLAFGSALKGLNAGACWEFLRAFEIDLEFYLTLCKRSVNTRLF